MRYTHYCKVHLASERAVKRVMQIMARFNTPRFKLCVFDRPLGRLLSRIVDECRRIIFGGQVLLHLVANCAKLAKGSCRR